jgi:hypothetical protein
VLTIILTESQTRLENTIILLFGHPCGLRILLGQWEPLTEVDILYMAEENPKAAAALTSVPASPLPLAEAFNSSIDAAGGWSHITKTVRAWIPHNQEIWDVFVDYYVWARNSRSRIEGSQVDKAAQRHGVCRNTIFSIAKRLPGDLADVILRAPTER